MVSERVAVNGLRNRAPEGVGIGFVVFASGYFVVCAVGGTVCCSSGTFGTDTVTWA